MAELPAASLGPVIRRLPLRVLEEGQHLPRTIPVHPL
jgi:hypothetical protein